MANYEFEIIMALSDLIDVQADNVYEAENLAKEMAESYYPVTPAGYSLPWDNIDIVLIDSDGEDW